MVILLTLPGPVLVKCVDVITYYPQYLKGMCPWVGWFSSKYNSSSFLPIFLVLPVQRSWKTLKCGKNITEHPNSLDTWLFDNSLHSNFGRWNTFAIMLLGDEKWDSYISNTSNLTITMLDLLFILKSLYIYIQQTHTPFQFSQTQT